MMALVLVDLRDLRKGVPPRERLVTWLKREAVVTDAGVSWSNTQKAWTFAALKAMGVEANRLSGRDAAVIRRVHSQSFAAFAAYAIGLDRLEAGDYPMAFEALAHAVVWDPSFLEAKRLFAATPRMKQSLDQAVQVAIRGGEQRATLLLSAPALRHTVPVLWDDNGRLPSAALERDVFDAAGQGDPHQAVELLLPALEEAAAARRQRAMEYLTHQVKSDPEKALSLFRLALQSELSVGDGLLAALQGLPGMGHVSSLLTEAANSGLTVEGAREAAALIGELKKKE